ncbi:MAG: GNAT family N-acetyltransferase [Pseudotabrizicola sp.]|uniref:GNAT family N-acetyltransferase n=1 Tax=Pseudotabrizicola sp. TaxID=2939647 RepID=UPI002730DBBC|nr:GNAT family N-acetyltransferase [Pseudotabrizicola sp.]MDP2079764.1 GNAT family N-acetyltransferase [Pseudotabrizicola sp.]MDZ7574765.1 GNAT family N-acetyltransferase [Pseudotabrizicola sp.]
MTQTDDYRFHKATVEDLDMLAQWQSHPHVSAWWGSDHPFDEGKLKDPLVARWIVTANERPFAFMQDYSVHGWNDHHFFRLPKGSRGIDQFIGDPAMIGIGHGSAFIAARIQVLFEQGAPVIVTDPHPENARAIAVYKKLGFEAFGAPQATKWGLILPMRVSH